MQNSCPGGVKIYIKQLSVIYISVVIIMLKHADHMKMTDKIHPVDFFLSHPPQHIGGIS